MGWLHGAIMYRAAGEEAHWPPEMQDRALAEVCHAARQEDSWASWMAPTLRPTWSSLATCKTDMRRHGMIALGRVATSSPTLAAYAWPHVVEGLKGVAWGVRAAALDAMA